jgi:hypothetical protein
VSFGLSPGQLPGGSSTYSLQIRLGDKHKQPNFVKGFSATPTAENLPVRAVDSGAETPVMPKNVLGMEVHSQWQDANGQTP